MKIICTKEEYATMLRTCDLSLTEEYCRGCVLTSICGETLLEDAVEITITEDEE